MLIFLETDHFEYIQTQLPIKKKKAYWFTCAFFHYSDLGRGDD